jgi:hypothetical protein
MLELLNLTFKLADLSLHLLDLSLHCLGLCLRSFLGFFKLLVFILHVVDEEEVVLFKDEEKVE